MLSLVIVPIVYYIVKHNTQYIIYYCVMTYGCEKILKITFVLFIVLKIKQSYNTYNLHTHERVKKYITCKINM